MDKAREYRKMLEHLKLGLITPRSVVGKGYKNARVVAINWLKTQIHNALNEDNKVSQLHGNSNGENFASREKAMRSPVYKSLENGDALLVSGLIVTEYGVCNSAVGGGFLVFIKTGRPKPLSMRVA